MEDFKELNARDFYDEHYGQYDFKAWSESIEEVGEAIERLAQIAKSYGADENCKAQVLILSQSPDYQDYPQEKIDEMFASVNRTGCLEVYDWGYGFDEELYWNSIVCHLGFNKELWLKNIRAGKTELFPFVHFLKYTPDESNEILNIFTEALREDKPLWPEGGGKYYRDFKDNIRNIHYIPEGENVILDQLREIVILLAKQNVLGAWKLLFDPPHRYGAKDNWKLLYDIPFEYDEKDNCIQSSFVEFERLIESTFDYADDTFDSFFTIGIAVREGIYFKEDPRLAGIIFKYIDSAFEAEWGDMDEDGVLDCDDEWRERQKKRKPNWFLGTNEETQYVVEWLKKLAVQFGPCQESANRLLTKYYSKEEPPKETSDSLDTCSNPPIDEEMPF